MRLWDEAEMQQAEREMQHMLNAALWLVGSLVGVVIACVVWWTR